MNIGRLRSLIREAILLELRSTPDSPVPSDSKYFARPVGDGFVLFYSVGSDGHPEAIPGTVGYFYDSTYVRGAKPVSSDAYALNPEELKKTEELVAAGLYKKTEKVETYPEITFKYRKDKPGSQMSSWKSPEDVPKKSIQYSPLKPAFEFLLVDTEKGEVSLDASWMGSMSRRPGGSPGSPNRNKTYVIPSGDVAFDQKSVALKKLLSYLSSVDPRVKGDFRVVSPDDKFKGQSLSQVAKSPRAADVVMGTTGTITAYHGTSTKRWPEIEKKGLNPGKFEEYYSDLVRGYSEKNIYLTLDPHTAENYATRAAVWDDANALILQVEIPDPSRIVADEDSFRDFDLDREYTLTQTQRQKTSSTWSPEDFRFIDVVSTEPGGKVTIEKTQHPRNILRLVRLANRSITGTYYDKDIAEAPDAGLEWVQDEEYAALLKDISRKLVGFITKSLTGVETFAYRGRIPPKFVKKWKEYPKKAYPKSVEAGDEEAYEKTRQAVLKKTKTFESARSLRSLIREMLAESDPTARASAAGLAVCRYSQSGEEMVIIYSPLNLVKAKNIEKISERSPWNVRKPVIKELARTSILSGVTYRMNTNCNNSASIVQSVSARGGLGPAAYEVAMWDLSQRGFSLTSDRKNVSPDAARVWIRYADRGSNVSKMPFDDVENPKTPPIEDDCRLQKLDYLDQSYSLNAEPAGLSSMEAAHRDMIDWASSTWGSSGQGILEFLLQDAMIDLFSQKYSG
jgi:hypothetical protein